jgi:protein tyrosine phosphatase (PTP) superfamily phosphohydrolase (DUF442 family)
MSDLQSIYNFRAISDHLATSGQPTEEQFKAIKEAGFELVINLATSNTKYDLEAEAEIVTELGMNYVQIPVIWEEPTPDNLQQFFDTMEANHDKKIWVHCIANYRVSAFTMLYRSIKKGIPLTEAKQNMLPIWNPDTYETAIWADFIQQVLEENNIEADE